MQNFGETADRLSHVIERLVRGLRASVGSEQLSPAAASALNRLESDGPLGVTRLARAEHVSQPAMTQLVERLVTEGLVERRSLETDRRSVLVSLTDAGRAAIADRRRRRTERLEHDLDQLPPADRAAIAAAIPALERLVEAETARAATETTSTDPTAREPGASTGPGRGSAGPAASSTARPAGHPRTSPDTQHDKKASTSR